MDVKKKKRKSPVYKSIYIERCYEIGEKSRDCFLYTIRRQFGLLSYRREHSK